MTRSRYSLQTHLMKLLIAASFVGVSACQRDQEAPVDGLPGVPLSLGTEPLLSVGGLRDGSPEFHQVRPPSLLPDGRLLVPVQGDRVIHLFGGDGTRLASFGQPGQGPGEFESLMGAWARGDTIEAFDMLLRRITRFFPDGAVETISLGHVAGTPTRIPGILDDGWIMARLVATNPGFRERIVVDRFALDGTHLGEITCTEGRKRYAYPDGGIGVDPLSPDARFEMRAETLYVGDTLIPGIRIIDPKTLGEKEVRWPHHPELSPREAVRLVIDLGVARAPEQQAAVLRQRLEAAPIPERVPAFTFFIVDEEGFFWVYPYDPARHGFAPLILGGASHNTWTIYSPTGEEVGAIELPLNFGPVQITSDAAVGVQIDQLGVQSVGVYPLRRR